jgi:hypothetical protein
VVLARPHWAEELPKVHIKTPHLTQIHIFEEQVLMDMQTHWNYGDIQSAINDPTTEGAERRWTPTRVSGTNPSEAPTTW